MHIDHIVPTIYAHAVNTALLLGKEHQPMANTTLNELFEVGGVEGVLSNEKLASVLATPPRMNYLHIGNGGLTTIDTIPTPSIHEPHHAGLYSPMPFAVAKVSDLTRVAKLDASLAMRTSKTIDGTKYYVWYLRRFKDGEVGNIVTNEALVTAGETTVSAFSPADDHSLLEPTPTLTGTGNNTTSSNKALVTNAVIQSILGPQEVSDIIEAAELLFGSAGHAIITEVATVTGVELPAPDLNVYHAQVHTHIATVYPLIYAKAGIEISVDVGEDEPLGLNVS